MGLQAFLNESDIVGLTDAQAEAAALATYSLPVDTTAYTYSGVAAQLLKYAALGWLPNMTTTIVGNMRPLITGIVYNSDSVGLTLDGMLTSGGYDFGTAAHRAIISAWTPGAPPDAVTLIQALLFVGAPTCPRWQAPQYAIYIDNLTNPTVIQSIAPTQSDITYERATMSAQANQLTLMQSWSTLLNTSINPALSSGSATKASIKALVAGW